MIDFACRDAWEWASANSPARFWRLEPGTTVLNPVTSQLGPPCYKLTQPHSTSLNPTQLPQPGKTQANFRPYPQKIYFGFCMGLITSGNQVFSLHKGTIIFINLLYYLPIITAVLVSVDVSGFGTNKSKLLV